MNVKCQSSNSNEEAQNHKFTNLDFIWILDFVIWISISEPLNHRTPHLVAFLNSAVELNNMC